MHTAVTRLVIMCRFQQLLDTATLQLKELSSCMSFLLLLCGFYASGEKKRKK